MSTAAVTFDTLKYVKTLKSAGFEEKQAEALAEVQKELLDANLNDLATKRDLKELEAATKRDLRELKLEIAAEIAPIKWGMAVCVAGVMAIFLKLFLPH
ncbi:MAG: DUF1640 domain-containing protein [Magnetococcales bacterium]|nr:DUF1640 domain-containing protein [Magnetococcales bacterium]